MNITSRDINTYQDDGFLVHHDLFNKDELQRIRKEASDYVNRGYAGVVLEKNSKIVRGAMGCHLNEDFFAKLACDSRLAAFPREILGSELYIHQFKINFKHALSGAIWPWHQDFTYWSAEDGMPEPRAISVALFLDDVTEFNGPLTFIRGSHVHQLLEPMLQYDTDSDWRSTVGESLKYELDGSLLQELYKDQSVLYAPKGKAGSVLFFHPLIAHGSTSNLSFHDRRILIITYNSIDNLPSLEKMKRPDFMASKNFSPILID